MTFLNLYYIMLYSLSTNVITDTAHAIAAMQSLSGGEEGRVLFGPILEPGRQGLLRLLVKNAFAEVIVALLPFITDCNLDDEDEASGVAHQEADDDSDALLQFELSAPGKLSSGAHSGIRRALEQSIAYKALQLWAISVESTEIAGMLGEKAAGNLAVALRSISMADISPCLRPAWPDW